MRDDWTPSFGLEQGKYGIKNDDKAHAYISLNGKLKKTKCKFFKDRDLVRTFLNHIEPRLRNLYPSISFNLRNVQSNELDYRRKKAVAEAHSNDEKLKKLLKNHM